MTYSSLLVLPWADGLLIYCYVPCPYHERYVPSVFYAVAYGLTKQMQVQWRTVISVSLLMLFVVYSNIAHDLDTAFGESKGWLMLFI